MGSFDLRSLALARTSDAANLSIIPEKMQEIVENLFLAEEGHQKNSLDL